MQAWPESVHAAHLNILNRTAPGSQGQAGALTCCSRQRSLQQQLVAAARTRSSVPSKQCQGQAPRGLLLLELRHLGAQ